jgi:hypothetical protein
VVVVAVVVAVSPSVCLSRVHASAVGEVMPWHSSAAHTLWLSVLLLLLCRPQRMMCDWCPCHSSRVHTAASSSIRMTAISA